MPEIITMTTSSFASILEHCHFSCASENNTKIKFFIYFVVADCFISCRLHWFDDLLVFVVFSCEVSNNYGRNTAEMMKLSLSFCVTSRALFQYKDHLSMYIDFHYKGRMVMRPSYLYNVNPYTNSRYRDFHYKDKMALRPSYLYNVNPYTNSRYRDFHYKDKMVVRLIFIM